MSYLNSMNLVFTGDFKSDVSTVNNDVRHYDNKNFEKRFQLPKAGDLMNGWWNPKGGALFQFVNCTVKKCIDANGTEVKNNPLVGLPVSNSGDRSGGKMVDLDPQMQMTSELWGVKLKLTGKNGELLFSGDILHTGFRDLQNRQFNEDGSPDRRSVNGQPLGATFYSVLENVEWGNVDEQPFIAALKENTDDNKLRIVLSTFSYYYAHTHGRFAMGKLIGNVSTWKRSEPLKFTSDRRYFGSYKGFFSYGNFGVNDEEKWMAIDLGMSLPLAGAAGEVMPEFKEMTLAVANNAKIDGVSNPVHKDSFIPIGDIVIKDTETWLMETGGIVSFELSADAYERIQNNQLLLLQKSGTEWKQIAHESVNGLFLRADQNVQRIDPGDKVDVDLFLFKWGKPVSGQQLDITLDPKVTGAGAGPSSDPDPPKSKIPPYNVPEGKVLLSETVPTNQYGRTTVTLTGTPPGNPRSYIDGQIYLFSYTIKNMDKSSLNQYWNDKIIVHLRDEFAIPEVPTWQDVREIWVQFGNLYPIMSHHIMDFSVRNEILKHKDILTFSFSRNIKDALYMPVTRDLSRNKMITLIKWLNIASVEDQDVFVEESVLKRELEEIDGFTDLPSEDFMSIMTLAKAGDARAFDHPIFNQPKSEQHA